jgi:phosphoglycolate phosphatase-like HAD superfamily hydrolase
MTPPAQNVIILWDIDGTLVLNAPSPADLYHSAVERAVERELPVLVEHQHGRTDAGLIADHVRAHGFDEALISPATAHLQDLSEERHRTGARRRQAPGTDALLRRFAKLGWRNALLTGNSQYRAQLKLSGAGFDLGVFDWDDSFFGEVEVERDQVTGRAAGRLSGSCVVILGDTPRDGAAAAAAGIPFFAVASGTYTTDELQNTNALIVARDCVVDAQLLEDAIRSLAPLPDRHTGR